MEAQNSKAFDPARLGLKPVVRWLPDTRDPEFLRRYREQRGVIDASVDEGKDIGWWEQLQTDEGWV